MKLIRRIKYLEKIHNALKYLPVVVLTGSRQVGKSSIMEMLDFDNKLYLDGQDIDVQSLFVSYNTILEYLKVNLNKSLSGYLFIDEFQYINNVSTILKLLTDHNKNLKVIASGSSSLDILQNVKESMAGRVRVIEVYSLSFGEYLDFRNHDLHEKYYSYPSDIPYEAVDKQIISSFKQFLIYGGYPRVALAEDFKDKIELLDDIYKIYLMKDVKSFIKNEDSVPFNNLLRILAAQSGNMFNINELSNTVKLPYNKVAEYIYLLEQMYIIKTVVPYTTNKRKEVSKMRKVFFLDTGLRNIIYNSFNDIDIRVDNGSIFENFVFLEMMKGKRKTAEVKYYRTKDGSEIDFIFSDTDRLIPVEVKYKNFGGKVSIPALKNFSKIAEPDKPVVININLNQEYDDIRFLPGLMTEQYFAYSE